MQQDLSRIKNQIRERLEKGEEITPFLFLGKDSGSVFSLVEELLVEYFVDRQSFFVLRDDGNSLKIAQMKDFFSQSFQKPRFAFQIFLIENLARITPEAANACLKVLEEPGAGNIIFLTNPSESGILDTILSRVQIVRLPDEGDIEFSEEYYDMIDAYL